MMPNLTDVLDGFFLKFKAHETVHAVYSEYADDLMGESKRTQVKTSETAIKFFHYKLLSFVFFVGRPK